MAVLCGIRPGLKNRISDLAVRIFLSLIGLAAVELIGGSNGQPFRRHDRRRCICLFYGGFCAKGYCDHHIGSYCKRAGKADD